MGWGGGSGWSNSLGPTDTGGWASGAKAGGAAAGYSYGWPSGGTAEANVAAQWLFDEAAGNIVDEVGGVTLTKQGTPQYSQAGGGLWSSFSGILFDANADYFNKADSTASMFLGTSDATLEWVADIAAAAAGSVLFIECFDGTDGYRISHQSAATAKTYHYFRSTDLTAAAVQLNVTEARDGATHKYRLKLVDRGGASAKLYWYIDGVAQGGSYDFSLFNGKTIPADIIKVGATVYNPGGNYTIREFRLSNNGTNNSGGPNGG